MNREAFERVIQMHQKRIHSYATYMLRDVAEAQDVAQEALIRLWEHAGRVDTRSARPWLMRTTHNLCIDRIRRSGVRAEADEGPTLIDRTSDESPGPERLAQSGDLGRLIREALSALSSKDRAVILLREVQGLPYDEMADILGMPLGTIKARLHRAREKLRSRLVRSGVRARPNDQSEDISA